MKKKMLAVLLSLSMLTGVLAGCGGSTDQESTAAEGSSAAEGSGTEESVAASEEDSNFNETGYPIVDEQITLKVLLNIRDVDSIIDVEEMPAVQRLEEETNIHIEWEVVKSSDWDTKLNLMFASGEYPDIILAMNDKVDTEEYGVTQGLLIPIDELTEQYMPNYTSRIEMEDSDPTESLVASDGHKYSVGYLVGQNINTKAHFFINTTWLDALGLDMPTNNDELLDVLRAFKTQDPDGDGTNNEVPLEIGVDAGFYGISYLLPLFGVPVGSKWIYIDNDKQVQFAPTQDGFRECMEWLHTCYEEDLIDPEFISQDNTTIETKLKEGNAGFFTCWRLQAKGFDDGVLQTCELYMPQSSTLMYRYLEVAATDKGAFLTCTNEYVEESLRWLDAMMDTEMMFSLYYGEQDATDGSGWTYNAENGKIDSINDGVNEMENYIGCSTMFFGPGKYLSEVFNMSPQRIEKTEYCEQYDAAGIIQKYSNDYLDMAPLTSEQLQSVSLKETDIENAVLEYMATFVTEGVTDESWNEFVAIFDGMNVDEYVTMYQTAIDTMDLE